MTDAKACAKLVFTTIQDKSVLCSRSIQYLKGLKKDIFTNMDQYLNYIKSENEFIVISQKIAEIDQNMPLLLGTSRALIENVLLCH